MSRASPLIASLKQFFSYSTFTKVQDTVIPVLIESDENVVVAAPTGSGKTFLLEVAMLRLFASRLLPAEARHPKGSPDGVKAVYICPIKALAREKCDQWAKCFPALSVVSETGDEERSSEPEGSFTSVSTADIIITTPERWDSITRRWKEATILNVVNSVGLLLLDEVHTVHEERGAALEAVVSRMKAIRGTASSGSQDAAASSTTTGRGRPFRIIAISGTLPNASDIAEWLQAAPRHTFTFTSADRPVPLTTLVIGYPNDSGNPFAFDRFLSFKLFGVVRQHSEGRPTIVFCASRREAVSSAARLVEDIRGAAARDGEESQLQASPEVQRMAGEANDKQLRGMLLVGIAFHHAALTLQDRRLVERMFVEQYIAVICTTSTLALGVNLPAHLVVVKGTTLFASGTREDMPLSVVAQMCGRAGRPGLDSHGVALVLTTERKVSKYNALCRGDVYSTVESQLHRHMVEHVNAEVALRTIHSFGSAMQWVRTTFLWIRLRKNPQHYGLVFATKTEEQAFSAEVFLERLLERVLTLLSKERCVTIRSAPSDEGPQHETSPPAAHINGGGATLWSVEHTNQAASGPAAAISATVDRQALVESTRVGRAMSRLYILFGTVQTFNAVIARRRQEAQPSLGHGKDGGEAPKTKADAKDRASRTGQLKPSLAYSFKLQHVLALLSQSEEACEVHLRQGDRGPLNAMNRLIRFPIREGHKSGREVREDWHKAYVLIQSQLAQLPVSDVSLRNDFLRLWSLVPRVARFLQEFAQSQQSFSFILHANLLQRSVDQRMWPDGAALRQLDGVSDAVAKALARGGYGDLQSVLAADPRQLEGLCGRLPPFGEQLIAQVRGIPRCTLEVVRDDDDHRDAARSCVYHICISPEEKIAGFSSVGAGLRGGAGVSERRKSAASRRALQRAIFFLLAGQPSTDTIYLLRSFSASHVWGDDGGLRAAPLRLQFDLPIPSGAAVDGVEVHLIPQWVVGSDVTSVIHETNETAAAGLAVRQMGDKKLDFFCGGTAPAPAVQPNVSRSTGKSSRETTEHAVHSAAASPAARPRLPHQREPPAASGEPQTGGKVEYDQHSFNALLKDLRWIDGGSDARPRRSSPPAAALPSKPNGRLMSSRRRNDKSPAATEQPLAAAQSPATITAVDVRKDNRGTTPPPVPPVDVVQNFDRAAIAGRCGSGAKRQRSEEVPAGALDSAMYNDRDEGESAASFADRRTQTVVLRPETSPEPACPPQAVTKSASHQAHLPPTEQESACDACVPLYHSHDECVLQAAAAGQRAKEPSRRFRFRVQPPMQQNVAVRRATYPCADALSSSPQQFPYPAASSHPPHYWPVDTALCSAPPRALGRYPSQSWVPVSQNITQSMGPGSRVAPCWPSEAQMPRISYHSHAYLQPTRRHPVGRMMNSYEASRRNHGAAYAYGGGGWPQVYTGYHEVPLRVTHELSVEPRSVGRFAPQHPLYMNNYSATGAAGGNEFVAPIHGPSAEPTSPLPPTFGCHSQHPPGLDGGQPYAPNSISPAVAAGSLGVPLVRDDNSFVRRAPSSFAPHSSGYYLNTWGASRDLGEARDDTVRGPSAAIRDSWW